MRSRSPSYSHTKDNKNNTPHHSDLCGDSTVVKDFDCHGLYKRCHRLLPFLTAEVRRRKTRPWPNSAAGPRGYRFFSRIFFANGIPMAWLQFPPLILTSPLICFRRAHIVYSRNKYATTARSAVKRRTPPSPNGARFSGNTFLARVDATPVALGSLFTSRKSA